MSAITVRGLPADVHAKLRQMAATANLSVEALVRNLLAEAARRSVIPENKPYAMSEGPPQWSDPKAPPAPQHSDLWGALRGHVQIPAGTDPTAPVDQNWEAAR